MKGAPPWMAARYQEHLHTPPPAGAPQGCRRPASAGPWMARSEPLTRTSEIADDVVEHGLDGAGVAGVVRSRVGRLGHRPQRGEVGVLAVANGEQPHRRRRL